jgi:phosphoribosyl-AMP cyclohydrolase
MVEPDFEKGGGLVPVIVQDQKTKDVLMLAYMNRESWIKTLETLRATYWSRSRNALWVKGETSGHYQIVREVLIDCDGDTILLVVEQLGDAACHTGYKSCFHRRVSGAEVQIVGKRLFDPGDVYR